MRASLPVALAAVAGALATVAGCGGAGSSTPAPATTGAAGTTAGTQPPSRPATRPSPSALQVEARSAATGDIPDNQVFLTFRNTAEGYSIRFPEGWAQRGAGATVTFRDRNNIVRVVVDTGSAPSVPGVRRELASLAGARATSGPREVAISGARAVKVVYTTESPPSPVTGKRVTLVVDRYYLWHAGKRAVLDLGTPVGVDNVDAYRLIVQSFRWR